MKTPTRSTGVADKTMLEMIVGAVARFISAEGYKLNGARRARIVDQIQRYLESIRTGESDMRKEYVLSVKIDFDDPTKHAQFTDQMRRMAQEALAKANLMSDSRKPQVSLQTEDFFEGTEDINLQQRAGLDASGLDADGINQSGDLD